jgi:hypothetical protein
MIEDNQEISSISHRLLVSAGNIPFAHMQGALKFAVLG